MQEKERHQISSQFNRFTSHIVLGVPRFQITVNRAPARIRVRTVHRATVPLLERIDAIARIILNVPRRCDLRAFPVRGPVTLSHDNGHATTRQYRIREFILARLVYAADNAVTAQGAILADTGVSIVSLAFSSSWSFVLFFFFFFLEIKLNGITAW